ncbi:MAG TPA: hypothetical protein VJR89_21665 [Polyangiales bacterium]|nr:hypothetical protein [Polyangiales bacterium]
MIEALLVFAVVGLLVLLGTCAYALTIEALLIAGAACIAVGFVIGLPAGALYHVRLYRCLAQRGPVPRAFWLRPTSLHPELESGEWRGIAPWFVVGGTGFALIVLGCLIVMMALLRA